MAIALNIALLDAQPERAQVLAGMLRARDCRVKCLESEDELIDGLYELNPEVFVIDAQALHGQGFQLFGRLREAHPRVGLVCLTPERGLSDRLASYEAGADACLAQPVNPEELAALVDALGRRIRDPFGIAARRARLRNWRDPLQVELFEMPPGYPLRRQSDLDESVELALDLPKLTLEGPGGVQTVSAQQASLLSSFARAPGLQLERWQVAESLGQADGSFSESGLEVRMARLRRKLAEVSRQLRPLRAVRGVGYRLCVRLVVID